MAYIKEPNGITLTVDKIKLTNEVKQRIEGFISKSKQRNAELIARLEKHEPVNTIK